MTERPLTNADLEAGARWGYKVRFYSSFTSPADRQLLFIVFVAGLAAVCESSHPLTTQPLPRSG